MIRQNVHSSVIAVVLLAVIAAATFLFGAPFIHRIVTEMFIMVVLVVGIYVFVGNSGIVSFGHIGFMAIGAYFSAWLLLDPMIKSSSLTDLPQFILDAHWPPWAGFAAAGAAAGFVALVTGAVLMRLSGVAAAISSFAFMAIVFAIASNWTAGTGGTSALMGLPSFATLGTTFLAALAAVCAAGFYDGTRWGLALRAIRDEDVAATAIGLLASRMRLIAFVVSAVIVGCAGALHASYLAIVTPDSYFLDATFLALAMLVLGGMYSLHGAVVGVVAVTVAGQLLTGLERGVVLAGLHIKIPNGSEEFAVAVLMCIALVYRPEGLVGRTTFDFGRLLQRGRPARKKEEHAWPGGQVTSERENE